MAGRKSKGLVKITPAVRRLARGEMNWALAPTANDVLKGWLTKLGGNGALASVLEAVGNDARAQVLADILRGNENLEFRDALIDSGVSPAMLYGFIKNGKVMLSLMESIDQITAHMSEVIETTIQQAKKPNGFKDRKLLFETVTLIKGSSVNITANTQINNPTSFASMAAESEES